MPRTQRQAEVRPATSPYCRTAVQGINHKITERRLRQLEQRQKKIAHRAKNGINDPISFYQLLDAVLNIPVGEEFSAKSLAEHLNVVRPRLVWDPVTVGRILNDITESLAEINGPAHAGIFTSRDWSGRYYQTVNDTEGWIAMMNLLDDLYPLAEQAMEDEASGHYPKRLESPLGKCASLLAMIAVFTAAIMETAQSLVPTAGAAIG